MRLSFFLFTLLGVISCSFAQEADWLVIRSSLKKPIPQYEGNQTLLKQKFTPASTFKTILCWTALEEGTATLETRFESRDSWIPKEFPQPLSMQEAMRHSSNEYFVQLARSLSLDALQKRLDIIGWGKLGHMNDPKEIVRGGDMLITPDQLHHFMTLIASGKIANSIPLRQAMQWESEHPEIRVHGKTGTYGGAAWMSGFAVTSEDTHIITTLCTYQAPNWQKAREHSTRLFHQAYQTKH